MIVQERLPVYFKQLANKKKKRKPEDANSNPPPLFFSSVFLELISVKFVQFGIEDEGIVFLSFRFLDPLPDVPPLLLPGTSQVVAVRRRPKGEVFLVSRFANQDGDHGLRLGRKVS
ncbi:hypothetical protein ISCGN_002327 [Ixodes scapularis]